MAATSGGPEVATILVEPDDPIALMVLGHGSGTPIHQPLMAQMAEALAGHGIATFRYNYPYSEVMTDYSPNLIDPLDVLLATTRAAKSAAEASSPGLLLFLGGRSMSSQVVSLALSREDWPEARGCVLYVFPDRWRHLLRSPVDHLPHVPAPMLFVQGGRDEDFTDLGELRSVVDGLDGRATLHVVEGADHFYEPPTGSGRTQVDALSEVASVTARWMRGLLE